MNNDNLLDTYLVGAIALNKALKRVGGGKLVPDLSKPVRQPRSGSTPKLWSVMRDSELGVYRDPDLLSDRKLKVARRVMQNWRDGVAKKFRHARAILRDPSASRSAIDAAERVMLYRTQGRFASRRNGIDTF